MLSRLRIKNFQKHEKIDVEFSPSVTTIVGPSDSGKSALIRAIRWVLFNKPSGTEFIRDGEEKCSVRLETENHKITRIRGKENTYKLDGETFRAFGNDVPPAIQDVARIGPINFQGQHDSPFWLSESAGQVSRNLNQIVNLGIIDSALSNTASILKKAKWESESTRKAFNEAKEKRSALAWATEANNELGAIEASEVALEAKTEAQNRLSALVEDVGKYTEATKDAKSLLSEISALKKLTEKILDHDNKSEELTNAIENVEEHETKLKEKTKVQKRINQQLKKFKVCPLCQQQMTT
tara:strand:+ start:3559 stop:4446 length:888 start_codon:yes stop_codon:yes gene_type:complete